jgi:predicted nucleic acid-binding protein
VIVVADSSPLIVLTKIGCFGLLERLYPRLHISQEVYDEIVVAGVGMPGASQVAKSDWIEVRPIDNANLIAASLKHRLGLGELSTVLLGKELRADIALMDDLRARRLAKNNGLEVRGTVGVLELLYGKSHLTDLRKAFQDLLANGVYVARELLEERLQDLKLPPLNL